MDIYDENEYHDDEEEDNHNADSNGGDDDEMESKCGGVSAVTGSLAERRAAKLGFNAERIRTALFRTDRAVDSPVARSPCLMIPPGISPTALLDSPIMLPNSQLSPTTGTFSLPVLDHESSIPNKLNPADNSGSKQNQGSSISRLIKTTGVDCQAVLKTEPPADFELPARNPEENSRNTYPVYDVKFSNVFIADEPVVHEDVGTSLPLGMVRNSEDGYNWRKYGQKQVKGSEYPRSYYKCTHPNCQVKKKVERSYDGQITEIIYKGTHNHLKPQTSRRPLTISSDEMYEKSEGNVTCVKVEDGPVWRNFSGGLRDFRYGSDLERTPSTSILTELSDQLSPTQGKSSGVFGSPETPEFSSTQATHGDNDEDDGVTQGSMSLADDVNDVESRFKRRRMENSVLDTNLTSRAIREPKVVIQIESAEDILEDGYRWRKYGQKVVKGNPNPRSYYKCTSPGCQVRKHVERASNDLKCVITTYEGKHNHLVPAARNSSHVNTNSGASLLPPIDRSHSPLTLHRNNSQNHKSPLQIHDIKPEFISNDYLSSNFLVTPPPLYQMKFPQIQSPYGSLGLNLNTNLTQSTSINSAIPDFSISLPWGLPSSSNLSLGSFGLNNNHGKPIVPIQSFVSGQQLKENDIRLVRPKQERKDENPYDACLPIVDHANGSSSATSSSSLLYHQLMGNFTS